MLENHVNFQESIHELHMGTTRTNSSDPAQLFTYCILLLLWNIKQEFFKIFYINNTVSSIRLVYQKQINLCLDYNCFSCNWFNRSNKKYDIFHVLWKHSWQATLKRSLKDGFEAKTCLDIFSLSGSGHLGKTFGDRWKMVQVSSFSLLPIIFVMKTKRLDKGFHWMNTRDKVAFSLICNNKIFTIDQK